MNEALAETFPHPTRKSRAPQHSHGNQSVCESWPEVEPVVPIREVEAENRGRRGEKKAVTRYVEYITKAPQPGGSDLGRYGPVPEGMVMWLVGITALVAITLWIGARA